MIQVRRIILLKAEGLSKLKISASLHLQRATLDSYIYKFQATGKSYAELLQYSDDKLNALVFNNTTVAPKPDNRIDVLKKHLDYFKQELSRPGVTQKTVWEEYQETYPEGYSYIQFCEYFADTSNAPRRPCTLPIVPQIIYRSILSENNRIISMCTRVKL